MEPLVDISRCQLHTSSRISLQLLLQHYQLVSSFQTEELDSRYVKITIKRETEHARQINQTPGCLLPQHVRTFLFKFKCELMNLSYGLLHKEFDSIFSGSSRLYEIVFLGRNVAAEVFVNVIYLHRLPLFSGRNRYLEKKTSLQYQKNLHGWIKIEVK